MAKARATKEPKDLPELPPPNPHSRWVRLAFTLAPLILVLLARQIVLPNVDVAAVERVNMAPERYSIVALGILPFMSAALLVEVVAVLVPRWRHLRHGGVIGRAKLQRATNILAILLAVFQGYSTAVLFHNNGWVGAFGYPPLLLMMITLVAATMCLKLMADFISNRGLANGYGVMIGAFTVMDGVGDIWKRPELFTVGCADAALGKVIGIAALTWFGLEK